MATITCKLNPDQISYSRASDYPAWAPASVAPVTASNIGTTTCTITAVTDEATGTAYCYSSESITPPYWKTIVAGTNAIFYASIAVTTGGFTFNVTGLTPSTTTYHHIVHVSSAGRPSVTTTVTVLTLAVAGGARKWFPGHYMVDRSYSQSTRLASYNAGDFANSTTITGAGILIRWKDLEGATQGDYSAGMTMLETELDHLNTLPVPKKLFLRVNDKPYNGYYAQSKDSFTPAYISANAKNYHVCNGFSDPCTAQGHTPCKRWDSQLTDWYIAMWQAYGAAFDGHPALVGVCPWQESTYGTAVDGTIYPAGAANGYSAALDVQQTQRLYAEMVAAFPSCLVWNPMNHRPWLQADKISYITYLHSIKAAVGNPDSLPNANPPGQQICRILRGYEGGTDWRGTIPIVMAVEGSSLGWMSVGDATAAQHEAFMNDTMQASYILWDRNNEIGNNNQRWYNAGTNQPGGIQLAINANPVVYTSKPTGY